MPNENNKLQGFTLFRSYYEAAKELPDEQRLAYYDALMRYALNGEEPNLTGLAGAMFTLTRPYLDKSRNKSRFMQEPNEKQTETKQEPNENQTDTDLRKSALQKLQLKLHKEIDKDERAIPPLTPPCGEGPCECGDVQPDSSDASPATNGANSEPLARKRSKRQPDKQPKTQYAEFVSMTNDEYASLIAKLGEHGAQRCVEILDNYKGASGRRYASDYRAILSWAIKRYEDEQTRPPTGGVSLVYIGGHKETVNERNNRLLACFSERGMKRMTEQELRRSLSIMSTNYNKALDANVVGLWSGLFIRFDAQYFYKACLDIIASSRFFPTAAEIIDAYQRVKREADREKLDKLKSNQRLLPTGRGYCYHCDNTGFCHYENKAGAYCAARCDCPHGRDRSKFSEAQIDQKYLPEPQDGYNEHDKSMIRRGENPFYIPTIREVLGEDLCIFEARKKESYLSRRPLTDDEKAEILKKMTQVVANGVTVDGL